MLKKILKLEGTKELARKEQQVLLGGRKEKVHCVLGKGCMEFDCQCVEYGCHCIEPECFYDLR